MSTNADDTVPPDDEASVSGALVVSSGDKGTTDASTAPKKILRSPSEEEFWQHSVDRGRVLQERIQRPREKAVESAYLSDEAFEDVAVWICSYGNGQDEEVHDEQERKIREDFNLYKHHHFRGAKWGFYDRGDTKKDEGWFISDPPLEPEPELESESYRLCEMCRHIDFTALLTVRGLPANNIPGPTKIEVWGVDRIIQRTDCPFCDLVTRKLKADGTWDLNNAELIKYATASLNVLDEGEENNLRLEFEFVDHFKERPTQRFVIQKGNKDDDYLPFHAMEVRQDKANLVMLDAWLQFSEDISASMPDMSHDLTHLRLIDVEKECICEISVPCRYACVSYVWGKVEQPLNVASIRDQLQESGGLSRDRLDLPLTIRDAIEVTRQVGIPYLWVDALCIEQDNPSDKQRLISQMTSIYGNSTLTIVASSNQTSMEGLPGVSTTPRSRAQIKATVQGNELYVAFHDIRLPIPDIEQTKWNSRGWTYQERQLSRRLVFFTEAQMIFSCAEFVLYEDTLCPLYRGFKPKPLDEFFGHANNPMALEMRVLNDPFVVRRNKNIGFKGVDSINFYCYEKMDPAKGGMQAKGPIYDHKVFKEYEREIQMNRDMEIFWNVYRAAVYTFTQRDFTVQSDVVPAFIGLAGLISEGSNIEYHFNIPDGAFEQALLWYPKSSNLRRREHKDGQPLYPSWSWAGWEGPVMYRGRRWHNAIDAGPISAVKWFRSLSAQDFYDKYVEQLTKQMDAASLEDLKEKVRSGDKELEFLDVIDPSVLYHFDAEKKGWLQMTSRVRNQHAFIHDAYKCGTGRPFFFNYPVPLPGEEKIHLPDSTGRLCFQAYSNELHFVDIMDMVHEKTAYAQKYLQIGLNDEKRSHTPRAPWQRIIYHQGYRAGFLALNVPFASIEIGKPEQYRLIAMSRDDLPYLPPCIAGDDAYDKLGPLELHEDIGFRTYYVKEPEDLQKVIPPPNEDAEPDVAGKVENGDAHWDRGRFQFEFYSLYNVLLVKKEGSTGVYSRIGVGKLHWHAFHHAGATRELIKLI